MKMKLWVRNLIILIDVAAILFACWYLLMKPSDGDAGGYLRIYVTHSDGTETAFSFQTRESTFGEALRKAKKSVVEIGVSDNSTVISSADGEMPPNGMRWEIELNGTEYGTDPDTVPVVNRGKYCLVLKNGEV